MCAAPAAGAAADAIAHAGASKRRVVAGDVRLDVEDWCAVHQVYP